MPKAGLTMAGHLHPLIIRLITETVLMAGDFMNSDAHLSTLVHSNSLGLLSAPSTQKHPRRWTGGFQFRKIKKEREK